MRIRTIKPEFWTSLDMAKVSEPALILAVGLLNYADDKGYFVADARLIHGALTPLRELSRPIMECLGELREAGFINLCTGTNGRPYGHVVNFLKHQTINRPKASRIAPFWSDTPLDCGDSRQVTDIPIPVCSSAVQVNETVPADTEIASVTEPTPDEPAIPSEPELASSLASAAEVTLFSDEPEPEPEAPREPEQPKSHWIMELWNAHAPTALPRCTTWSKKRQTAARARLKEYPDRGHWQQAIESIADCPFLMGQNDRGWSASIDWLLLRPDSITKIMEGHYRCRGRPPALVGSSIAGEGDLSF
ncbi:hypothetical protein LLG95_05510 [bacterium]|nr:hypothetical protein [bacterium]